MLKKLNAKIEQFGQKKFLFIAAVLCMLCDILNMVYIVNDYLPISINTSTLSNMLSQTSSITLSNYELNEFKNLYIQTISIVFNVFLVIHLIIYALLAKDFNWAKKYVSGYSLIGAILTIVMIPSMIYQLEQYLWALVMFLTTFAYLYTYQGLKLFKKLEQ